MDNIHSPIPEDKAKYFVNTRQKTYLKSTEIYIPDNPYEKYYSNLELSKPKKVSGAGIAISDPEELKERSLRRAHVAVKDIFMSNDFDLFVTFTFRSDRDQPERCRDKMLGWFKRQRKIDKNFRYVVVPEFHKDGKSLHFHALIKGYSGEIVRAINPKTNKPLVVKNRKIYDLPNYTLGHSQVKMIGDTEEDRIKSGFYLLKYLKKDMPDFQNKKRYWASRNLDKPKTIENPEEWFFEVTPDLVIPTDFGIFLYFDNNRIEIFL